MKRVVVVVVALLLLSSYVHARQEPGAGYSPPVPTPTPRVVVRAAPQPAVPEDAPLSDCPEGYKPEHIWYEKYDEQWWGDRFWAGQTCILKCVSLTCNQAGTMGGASNCHVVYVNSWGESKPPWCILE